MNELSRLVYLDALGVDAYIARRRLAGAAPSQRLRCIREHVPASLTAAPAPVVEASLPRSAAGAEQRPANPGDMDSVRAALEPAAVRKQSQPAPAADVPTAAVSSVLDGPVFSLIATQTGGRLWLEASVPGYQVGDNYQQLIASICMAMGWQGAPSAVQFNWPLNRSVQLDHSLGAARHAVSGFLQARLDSASIEAIVLLGALDDAWLDRQLWAGRPSIEIPSVTAMLRQHGAKRQAWAVLKPLRGASI